MNSLASAEVQRRGLAALEERLCQGPVHILKDGEPVAVVLSESEYGRLLARAGEPASALEWLLAQQPTGRRSTADIDRQVEDERDWKG
jgi:PHD/YefM family antitoxin component YafN of YafNO toxin-antitoxin module